MPKLSRALGVVEHFGPVEVGADNEEICCGRIGINRDDLKALQERGIVLEDLART